jgi:anti-anti-sigma factor
MTTPFSTRIDQAGDEVTVVCSGELDIATAPEAQNAIDEAVASECPVVRLDWSGLTFMDSTGIRLLLTTVRRCKEASRELVWQLSSQAQHALDAVGIHDELLDAYGDLEATEES